MSLSEKDIKKLSEKLSKLSLEEGKMVKDINEIIKYMELLNEIDTRGVKPTVNVIKKENKMRNDIVFRNIDPLEILNCSNQKVISRQIAISNIMK